MKRHQTAGVVAVCMGSPICYASQNLIVVLVIMRYLVFCVVNRRLAMWLCIIHNHDIFYDIF